MKTYEYNFQDKIHFELYYNFFRLFCKNKFVDYNHYLRADFKSFSEGIKIWYGGRENPNLSWLIYKYFSKGSVNHLVTPSEFIMFIREM